MYIADSNNNRIRKVTVSTGFITTIAGTGTASYSGDNGAATSATLNYPVGVALDAAGLKAFKKISFLLLLSCFFQATCTSLNIITIVSGR